MPEVGHSVSPVPPIFHTYPVSPQQTISIGPADFALSLWGHNLRVPYAAYLGKLPQSLWASRPALETLLRRLTLDQTRYSNISQMTGTVVGVGSDASGYLNQVSVRTKESGVENIDAVLVVGKSHALILRLSLTIHRWRTDCTGPSQAGIKWLRRAGFDSAISDDSFALELDRLKLTFDPKMHYSTCRIDVSPSLAEKLPIPGGYANANGPLLQLFPDMSKDGSYFGCIKMEANSCEL